jgi:hypothetical protein
LDFLTNLGAFFSIPHKLKTICLNGCHMNMNANIRAYDFIWILLDQSTLYIIVIIININ